MSNIFITRSVSKDPYEKEMTKDKVINLAGQSGSGKSTYAIRYFLSDKYLIVDTDEIFSEQRYKNTTGINKKLGDYFRKKYKVLPNLTDDFDLIYKEIIEYTSKLKKIIVIDCAQFHCIKDVSLLKGKIIIMRTAIDTCYERCIERYKKSHPFFTEDELKAYKNKKKGMYTWYKETNQFIKKLEEI